MDEIHYALPKYIPSKVDTWRPNKRYFRRGEMDAASVVPSTTDKWTDVYPEQKTTPVCKKNPDHGPMDTVKDRNKNRLLCNKCRAEERHARVDKEREHGERSVTIVHHGKMIGKLKVEFTPTKQFVKVNEGLSSTAEDRKALEKIAAIVSPDIRAALKRVLSDVERVAEA